MITENLMGKPSASANPTSIDSNLAVGRLTANPAETSRYHALDSLRASMMLLGIYLHAVVGYSREGGWPYKDPHPTAVYDWTLGLIHSFRMPLFSDLTKTPISQRNRAPVQIPEIRRTDLHKMAKWISINIA